MTTTPLSHDAATPGSFSLPGIRIAPKVRASETGGHFSMVQAVVETGGEVPAQIGRETKVFYVVSGEFDFLLGTSMRHSSDGDTIVVPAGAIHRFANAGTEPGKLFVLFSPGGHEDFLRELSDLYQDETVRLEDVQAINRCYGVEMIG